MFPSKFDVKFNPLGGKFLFPVWEHFIPNVGTFYSQCGNSACRLLPKGRNNNCASVRAHVRASGCGSDGVRDRVRGDVRVNVRDEKTGIPLFKGFPIKNVRGLTV